MKKQKFDIRQLELDLAAANTRLEELKEETRVTRVRRKSIQKELILALSEQRVVEGNNATLQNRIRRNVVGYCLSCGICPQTAWIYLYERLKAETGVNPFELTLGSTGSKLDGVRDAGMLPSLLKLVPEISTLKTETV